MARQLLPNGAVSAATNMNTEEDRLPFSVHRAPSRTGGACEPLFFNQETNPLFGCYHPGRGQTARNCGVVLCYPMGHEYLVCHRAFRQLAQRLSLEGFATLRFDYRGCGDSAGDYRDGGIAQWVSDICSAVEEIRRRAGVESVCLVGCRLGASLALLAGLAPDGIAATALWDPILNGNVWLHELERDHREMLLRSHVAPTGNAPAGAEILGFPLTRTMRAELEKLDLLATHGTPGRHVLLIESAKQVGSHPLIRRLHSAGCDVTHELASDPMPWNWTENPSKLLVPIEILQSIVAWLKRASA